MRLLQNKTMRLLTKQQRNQSRDYQFNQLLTAGYIREDYKKLVFFYHPTELILKAFKGTAANHYHYVRYRTIDRLNEEKERLKANADNWQKWREEQKEKNKGHKSSHAHAAAQIREKLKKAFPSIKFSVTSDSYSGGDAVRVDWTDGPTTGQVEAITGAYQYGSFDGMTDSYNNTNSRDDIPQVKYVTESRTMSDLIRDFITNQLSKIYGEKLDRYDLDRMVYQCFAASDIPLNVNAKGVELVNNDYKLMFEQPAEVAIKEERPAPPQLKEGQSIAVIKYSDKAIAVTGEGTRAIKDQLKALGGKFNFRLSCGAGWIFPATKQEQVIEMLKNMKGEQNHV